MRLDLEETSLDSVYVTVWASPLLPLHMGKIENASKMFEDHFGRQLQVFSLLDQLPIVQLLAHGSNSLN